MPRSYALLVPLLAAASLCILCAAAPESSDNADEAFDKTHSANGAAVGTLSWNGKGTGTEKKIGGLDAYVAEPQQDPTAAVLMFTDWFGYKTDNARLWADQLANEGFLVVVPDYFKGNFRKTTDTPESAAAWRALYPPDQVLDETAAVLADIRKQYPTVNTLGAQGFCWGGLYAVLLVSGYQPSVNASVVYHGSMITRTLVREISAPILFLQSDPALDQQLNTTTYNEFKTILDAKRENEGLDTGITYYPDMPHGFAMRGGTEAAVTAAADDAFQKGADFLKKHLQV